MNLGNSSLIRSVILIFCFGYVQNRRKIKTNNTNLISDPNSDIYLDSLQLLAKYGYNPQRHSVVTGDGYVVDLYRIPRNGPPVLLVHGIADSSDSWLVLGPENSLAYQLADLGYDVWLYNTRGNKYSKAHVRNIPANKYWNFTYEEMGTQDLPAVIDYILSVRSLGKLYYVGFSQGTTIFFIMCSLRPEYNDKVKHAVMLAPIALINNIKYPFIDILTKNLHLLVPLFNNLGIYDVYANNHLLNLYHAKVCRDGVPEKVHLVENVEFIRRKLPNVAGYIVFNKSLDFTHLEFIYGSRAKKFVNNPVVNIINNDYYAGLEAV
ncbi:hypothetical protein K1T71_005598 [Dendrolimus kikuchii]|uniref:Uncharacterized protein n=1 Tax=Dendrolimus kikuchii TaxID=765133 RepID=A0ACC1D4H1_9NEOP|nr:hypothetical protein K1T71_005598 [Dendrolimus kikuchii]